MLNALVLLLLAAAPTTPTRPTTPTTSTPTTSTPTTPTNTLHVVVQGAASVVVNEAALRALPHEPVTWRDKSGEHHGEGTALEAVLAHAGHVPLPATPATPATPLPPAQKHRALRSVIVVSGRDGYTAVFSAAELSSSVGATRAFVVWAEGNAAIPEAVGPLRLVVTTDKVAARAVRQLSTITVSAIAP